MLKHAKLRQLQLVARTQPQHIQRVGAKAKFADRSPRGLIMLVGLTMLLTGMEKTMADSAVTQRLLQVEHITMKTTKKFAEVEAALERNVPQLDPAIAAALANGDEKRATELERGAPLFIFLKRDHGAHFPKLPDDPARRCSTRSAIRTLHQK